MCILMGLTSFKGSDSQSLTVYKLYSNKICFKLNFNKKSIIGLVDGERKAQSV